MSSILDALKSRFERYLVNSTKIRIVIINPSIDNMITGNASVSNDVRKEGSIRSHFSLFEASGQSHK